MSQDEKRSDVLIVGAGPTGLYAALLLSHMGCSVCIIDKKDANDPSNNPTYLWSPRSLQLLQAFDLVNFLLEHGVRHWGLETFTNKGHGNAAVTGSHNKHPVWENEATEFNWSLSCESDHVCRVLSDALSQRKGVRVRYNHELIDMEDCENDTCLATILPTSSTHTSKTSKSKHHQDNSQQGPYYWKSQIVLGADGTHSFVRQKLGIAYERLKSTSVFYTIEATVTTNFPAARKMAVLSKGPNSLFYIGHRDNRAYISFEHKPKWSRLTIDDDVPLLLAQKHVKSIMEPYQIEFNKPHSYRRWTATERTSEEFSLNRRYFLAGGAAQSVCPEGILVSDLGLEQVNNLCWKLFLCLKHRGSPELLDTYEEECRSKLSDTRQASKALMHLFTQSAPSSGRGLNSTPSRELIYMLSKTKHGFIGEAPYHANMLNVDTASTISITSVDEADTIQAVTASFTQRAQRKIQMGAPGTLAPNSKLKPYTLFTLLVNTKETATPPGSIANGSKPLSSSHNSSKDSNSNDKDDRPPRTSTLRWRRERSNSTSSTSSSTTSWLLSPIIKRSSTSNPSAIPAMTSTTTTTATAVHSNTTSTAERWRRIKTNHYSVLDRMAQNASTSAFRLVIFCGSLNDAENLATLQRFRRHLEEPHSFMQRYEKLQSNHPLLSGSWIFDEPVKRNSSLSLSSISHRSSVSSSNRVFFYSPPTSPVSTVRTSLDQPRLTTSSDFHPSSDTNGASTSTTTTTTPSMFSFLYITSSSRTEIGKFLSDTKPAVVHATFPLGLDKVYLDHDQQAHTLYNVRHSPSVVVVRPDGYIGACVRLQHDLDFEKLDAYFDAFLRPPIDMTSAAAMAADYYDL
ncbi:FAD binding domain-containing protein [Zychaea mexicana]|uniref:FAD binding domain-containing protein n=1 Tax=Zychaea mexicana TaxID=64656 RepID=UPI0022FE15BF|nr:FAD binding domain-containing protein [Zychaea mexicana]KAI9499433.1 FAD binding domain-containing protein [Zychaea mexicana]